MYRTVSYGETSSLIVFTEPSLRRRVEVPVVSVTWDVPTMDELDTFRCR